MALWCFQRSHISHFHPETILSKLLGIAMRSQPSGIMEVWPLRSRSVGLAVLLAVGGDSIARAEVAAMRAEPHVARS